MTRLVRYRSPLKGPQGLAWDGESMWVTSAANGRLYALDPETLNIQHEFVPPYESLGITYTGSDFRLILAPAIDEPDLERDVAFDGERFWTADRNSHAIVSFTLTGKVAS